MFQKQFFPTLKNNPELAYFDSAASTQTHQSVLDAMHEYYTAYRSNSGRGEYPIANRASVEVENAREQVADLINASPENILFTAGATDSLNMIAEWCSKYHSVIITEAEHNANIVPWLEKGFTVANNRLKVVPVNDNTGLIELDHLEKLLSSLDGTALVSFCATSNVTGITQDWQTIATLCHKYGVPVAVDFCQTIAHDRIDLNETPIEWAVFSGHKMYGPTGVGVLYSSFDFSSLRSLKYGGGAVVDVTFDSAQYATGHEKHSPGTPNIAGIIGMGVAAELLTFVDFDEIHAQEIRVANELYAQGIDVIPNCELYVQSHQGHRSIFSLVPTKLHSSDVGTLLSHTNVAVRTGRVCAHPLVDRISRGRGIVRVSVAPYNTKQDVKTLISELTNVFTKYI